MKRNGMRGAMNTYKLETMEDASIILKHFNDFHDGFIKRITITSRDEFKEDKSQIFTGEFDIALDIAHYNYGAGIPPYNQVINVDFQNVMGIHFDLREITIDWWINRISITERKRTNQQGSTENCFAIKLTRDKLLEGKAWNLVEADLFTFTNAVFAER